MMITWEEIAQDQNFKKLSPVQQLEKANLYFSDLSAGRVDASSNEYHDARDRFRATITPTLKLSDPTVTAELLTLPKEDEAWVDREWWSERFKNMRQGLVFLAGGWAFMWVLTWVVGWIVRGFLGIPVGQDRRLEKG